MGESGMAARRRIGGVLAAVAAGALAVSAAGVAGARVDGGVPARAAQHDAVVLAAGDIAVCHNDGDEQTAAILEKERGEILALGDLAYPSGSTRDFTRCYDPSWGRLKARTHPAPGNHEYEAKDAAPYFDYFGDAAGPARRGWYSFEVGAWHVVSLNSNVDTEAGGEQARWLRADLAAHPAKCTLAYFHHPRFSSGPHGNTERMAALWQVLQDARADVVLSGHDHHYERFAPMTATGREDPMRGIRSFVVGTGGGERYAFVHDVPGSEFKYGASFGVLKLTLHRESYDWEFLPVGGGRPIDRGSARCH